MNPESIASESKQRMPKIVAAIPCFNEARFIGSVVVRAKKFVDSVIVIDDGSTDATAEIAWAAGADVYQHGRNQGYGAAIRSAIEKGRQLNADILVIIDGDGQHDSSDIPEVVKPIIEGKADVVVGSRFLGTGKKPPMFRRVGQRILTIATNVGSKQVVSDSQSGFRAYSSKALKALNLTEDGMSVSSEMQFAISKSGLTVAEMPINVSYLEKAKRNPVGHGVGVLSRVIVLISLRQPLLLLGLPGLAFMAGGLFLGIRVLLRYDEFGQLAVGNAFGAVLLILVGLLTLFTALMLQAMKELMRTEVSRLSLAAREYIPGGDGGKNEGDSE
jgi:glycosyltransferase involved in cell wall biosynthesis